MSHEPECIDGWAHAAKVGPLQAEIAALREALDGARDDLAAARDALMTLQDYVPSNDAAREIAREGLRAAWPDTPDPVANVQRGVSERLVAARRAVREAGAIDFACCPVHGLHGQRNECYVCGEEVEIVAMVPVAERERWREQKRTDDEREIAYVQAIGKLDAALRGMVDLYRHPDSGEVIVEAGSSDADDALIAAVEALDR